MPKRPPIILPIAPWEPDMPAWQSGHTAMAYNVIPRTPKSYGPLSSPAPLTTGLTARCQGAYFGIDTDGTVNGFAGDVSKLYRWLGSSSDWEDVSIAGGYTTPGDGRWAFFLFGDRIIATNYSEVPQSYIMGSSTDFANLSAGAPKARYGATIKSFVMLANTSDAVYGIQPQRAWWSGNGDPTNWPTPGSALASQYQSSFQDLVGDGGYIQGIVGNLGSTDGAIFMDRAIWRVVWVGGSVVFEFFPAEGARGTPAPGSIAQLGSSVFYLGDDGFYRFDGAVSHPIGANRVDKTFYTDVDQGYMNSISSAIDPINKLYIVAYPGEGHSGYNANKMIIYNWVLDLWSEALPLPDGFEIIVKGLSFGYTLDQLYTVLGYTIDGLPFPLSSRVWLGGALLLGLFDSNHKLNYFTGTPLAATVDTAEVQPNPIGQTRIYNTRPIVDGSTTPSVAIGTRNRQADSVSYSSAVAMNSLGKAPARSQGRYVRARMTLPASGSWTHLSGVELEGAPAGGRY